MCNSISQFYIINCSNLLALQMCERTLYLSLLFRLRYYDFQWCTILMFHYLMLYISILIIWYPCMFCSFLTDLIGLIWFDKVCMFLIFWVSTSLLSTPVVTLVLSINHFGKNEWTNEWMKSLPKENQFSLI